MSTELQIAKRILKGIGRKGFVKIGKSRCKNEEQTKQFLIIPFMELLGYSYMDIIPEYEAGYKGGKINELTMQLNLRIENLR